MVKRAVLAIQFEGWDIEFAKYQIITRLVLSRELIYSRVDKDVEVKQQKIFEA